MSDPAARRDYLTRPKWMDNPVKKTGISPGRRRASMAIFVFVLAAFLPALRNDFVNLDDPWYVTKNPHITSGLTWENIRWAFTTLEGGLWHPLTWLSYQLDVE